MSEAVDFPDLVFEIEIGEALDIGIESDLAQPAGIAISVVDRLGVVGDSTTGDGGQRKPFIRYNRP